jgi:hypothetical protein
MREWIKKNIRVRYTGLENVSAKGLVKKCLLVGENKLYSVN